MPELPDVDVFRQYINSTALHQKIDHVHVADDRILKDITARSLQHQVKGQSFESTRRHGKYLLVELSRKNWLAFHFGMTGYFSYYRQDHEKPCDERIRFDFENTYRLAFCNPRRLGGLYMLPESGDLIEHKGLGPDALSDLTKEQFKNLMSQSNAAVKAVLTDQQKMAGIGNIYADEILFQARIHPNTPAYLLKPTELDKLYKAIGQVLERAIEARAKIENLPDDFLLSHREEGKQCPRCQSNVEKTTIHGRSTYFCPKCQPS